MKYRRLTKEQLEELHPEFINFLATQSITANEWAKIKEEKPGTAEEELDVFSDLIWEGVLAKTEYLENISARQMHLFYMTDKEMKLIAIRILNPDIDLTTKIGFGWFKKHFMTDMVDIMTATKAYSTDKNKDKFELIEKGGAITRGELYRWFDEILKEE
ncbi:DUF6495 family protein [Sinomicrobium sp. M5D2P17]